jgi:hypothetical protein
VSLGARRRALRRVSTSCAERIARRASTELTVRDGTDGA